MVGILLIAHTPLATAFAEGATHVFGGVPDRLATIDVIADEDTALLVARATALAQTVDMGEGVLILTDLFGATPCNIASSILSHVSQVSVVSGLNMPMLLRAISYRHKPLYDLAELASEGGRGGVVCMAGGGQKNQKTQGGDGAQARDHHHQ